MPARALNRPSLPAALTLGLLLAYLGVILAVHRGDPLAFAVLGTRYSTGDPAGTSGYDGQFSYYIAVDPAAAPPHLDVPAYRFQRILYPMLARALAFGRAEWVPWSLVAVGIVAHTLGTWTVASLLAAGGVSPWYSLAYGLWAGFFFAVRLDLAEPLAYGLIAGALLLYLRGRANASAVLFGLALFAKETGLLFVLGQAAYLTVSRRWRDLGWLGLACLPFAAFQLFLWRWLGSPGLASGGDLATSFEWLPYMGLWRIGFHSLPVLGLFFILFGPSIVLPSAWGIGAALGRLLKRDWHPYHFALAANAGIIPFVPFSTFREPLGITRFACGLVLSVLLFGAHHKSARVLRYAQFWTALLVLLVKE